MRYATILQTTWDWRAAANFMLGGCGGALLFAAAWIDISSDVWLGVVAAGAALMGSGLTAVWFKIGRPLRAANVVLRPQSSWMTREAYVAALAFALTTASALLRWPWLAVMAGWAGFAFLFAQARILHASKGIPAWREAALQPLIVATGLTEGCAVLVLIQSFASQSVVASSMTLIVLVLLRFGAWSWYSKRLAAASPPSAVTTAMDSLGTRFVLIGHVLPLVLVLAGGMFPGWNSSAVLLATLAALLSGWHFKLLLVTELARVQGYGLGTLKRGHPLSLAGHTRVSEMSGRLRKTREHAAGDRTS